VTTPNTPKKISQFDPSDALQGTDVLPVVRSSFPTRKATMEQVDDFVDANSVQDLRDDLASTDAGKGAALVAIPLTLAEIAAGLTGVDIIDPRYPELDIRRYGAVDDYDAATETDGQVAQNATNNKPAFDKALLVATEKGGGDIIIEGGQGTNDFWFGNGIRITASNIRAVGRGWCTVRTTTPTSLGGTLSAGSLGSDWNNPIENVGIVGQMFVRNYLPDVGSLPDWQATTAYSVGDYVKNSSGHAYYCSVAGTSGASEPTVIAGSEVDGTVTWRDALNENAIAIAAEGFELKGPIALKASNKGITVQRPRWGRGRISNVLVGESFHDGIEIKAHQGASGQQGIVSKDCIVSGAVVIKAGRHGIHAESPFTLPDWPLLENVHILDCTVYEAGAEFIYHSTGSGFRINRVDGPVFRGNKVYDAANNGVHFRQCKNIIGDVHVEGCNAHGLNLQENEGFDFTSVYLSDVARNGTGFYGVNENGELVGGRYGRIKVVGDDGDYAYRVNNRASTARVVIGQHDLEAGQLGRWDVDGVNTMPAISTVFPTGKVQSFILQLTNDSGTLKHRFTAERLNLTQVMDAQLIDRIVSATETLTATPTGTNSSTAFANGGKVSSSAPNEFILNMANRTTNSVSPGPAVVEMNDTGTALVASVLRRNLDVNGITKQRWHITLTNAADGTAFNINTTNITAGQSIIVRALLWMP